MAEGPGMLDEMAGQRCHRQRHNQRLWKGQRWQKALELLLVEGPTVAEGPGIAGRRARCPAAAQVVSYSATVSACKRANGGSRPWRCWTRCAVPCCSTTLSPTLPQSAHERGPMVAEGLGFIGGDARFPCAAQRCHLQCHNQHLQEGQR